MTNQILKAIKSRRVSRGLQDAPIERKIIEQVLEAGRWAPSAGNRRPHRFVAVQDQLTLRLLRMVCPGMFQHPTAIIIICRDLDELSRHGIPSHEKTMYIDVGTAAENMILAAHSLGLGTGPVTSFSKAGVSEILNMPHRLIPEMILCMGWPIPGKQQASGKWRVIGWEDLTFWETFK